MNETKIEALEAVEYLLAMRAPSVPTVSAKRYAEIIRRFITEPAVPEGFRCVDITSPGYNGYVNLLWGSDNYPIALVPPPYSTQIKRALAQTQSQQGGEAGRSEGCVWRDNGDFWEASCDGVAWYFDTGGTPADHGMKYCFSCGRPIAAAPEQGEDDGL